MFYNYFLVSRCVFEDYLERVKGIFPWTKENSKRNRVSISTIYMTFCGKLGSNTA